MSGNGLSTVPTTSDASVRRKPLSTKVLVRISIWVNLSEIILNLKIHFSSGKFVENSVNFQHKEFGYVNINNTGRPTNTLSIALASDRQGV
ncbi:hypothetical protein NIES4073_15610 [Kalymmatonema gypsitolerans NIES-4073]|nr:hypothetical protein NIES4073_15610 [Scytonema sp. NIES-4073]